MWWRDPIRARIAAKLVIEREGWAVERVRRVTEKLQAGVAEHDRFETVVIVTTDHNAFTTPGRTVYVARRLVDLLPDDAATAFVIAHEIAHHHLGHLRLMSIGDEAPRHELERHADLHAIELCLAAGYEPDRCILALRVLDAVLLSSGDLEGALG